MPETVLKKHLVFSRVEGAPKRYVQDQLREEAGAVADLLKDKKSYIYICGLRSMEEGVEKALSDILEGRGTDWAVLRKTMREGGRYHVETY